MEPSGRKRLGQNLTLAAISGLLALGAAELALRLSPGLLPEEAQLRLHWLGLGRRDAHSVPHPEVGFLYRPNYRGAQERGDFRFRFTTDENGFRNPMPWPVSAEIVVVGDSEVFGYGVEDEQAWARLVASGLPQSRLMNLGLVGAAPQQYLRVFRTFGLGLRPTLLIFGLFPGNDFFDADTFDAWLRAGKPVGYDEWRSLGGDVLTSRRRLLRLLEHSHLFVFLNETRKNLGSPFQGRTVRLPGGKLRLVPRTLEAAAERARPDKPSFQLVLNAIEEARALAEEHGIRFLVLIFPTKEEVYLPLVGERAPALAARIAAELEARSIPRLDLTPLVQERARTDGPLFFEVDGHPNALGNQRIAEALLAHLRAHAAKYGLADWR